MGRLQELRAQIDTVNRGILELLEKRGDIVLEIAREKRSNGM